MKRTPSSTEGTAPDDSPEQLSAEVDRREYGRDGSRSEPIQRKSSSDVPGSIIHHESPGQRPGLQQVPVPLPPTLRVPAPPSPDYTIPAAGASPRYISPSDTPGSRYPWYQPENIQTPPYGHSQDPYSPYPNYLPDGSVGQAQSDLSSTFPDKTRIIQHRFAGFLFNIRTDATVFSKKLSVKPVDNHVEYYCSGVLLTKIKYKLERDIFSLCEDSDAAPLRDAKLCEKIEILMAPIVAGLFEEPWNPEGVNIGWGLRGCKDIGDGHLFHVDVVRDVEDGDMYDSQSRRSQPSSLVRSHPIVAHMNAFYRVPSAQGVRRRSRSAHVHHSIDHTQLLSVLRQVELLTAIELAKRSYLTGSAVASVIGSKDFSDHQINTTFSAEVPTLFGLFVSKLSCWVSRTSDFTSYSGSRHHFSRKYAYGEEPFQYQVPNGKECSTTLNSENVPSAEHDLHTLAATFPVAPNQSASLVDFDTGSEDEDGSSLDGQSLASGDGPFAHHVVDSSSEDDEEGGADRQSHASDEDLIAHSDNYNDDLLIGVDASHTESIRTDTLTSIDDSSHELSDKPSSTLLRRTQPPKFPTVFHHMSKANYDDVSSDRTKGEAAFPKSVSHAELQSCENEHSSSKDRATGSSGSLSHRLSLADWYWDGPTTKTGDASPPRRAVPEKPKNNEQNVDAQADHKEAADSDITLQSSLHVKEGQSHGIGGSRRQLETMAGSGNCPQPKALSAEVREEQKQQEHELREGGKHDEGLKGDGDAYPDAEGDTNSQQDKPPKNQDNVSHTCSAQEAPMKSQYEHQSEREEEKEGPGIEREKNSDKSGIGTDSLVVQHSREESDTSPNEEQVTSRSQGNRQTEEVGSRVQDSYDEERTGRDKVSVHESDDTRCDPVSILREPRFAYQDVERAGRKVMFTVPSSEHSMSDGGNGKTRLEDERHMDEFNEAKRAHLRAAYSNNPHRDNFPALSYMPPTPSPQSSSYSLIPQSSVVEPYQEAVAAGQIYDVPSYASEERPARKSSSNRLSGSHITDGSHHHYRPPAMTPLSHSSVSDDLDSLPLPAISRKHSHRFSRRSSYEPMRRGNISSESSHYTHISRRKKRIVQLIAKDTFSVTLGVVIVILSILAVALDPAEEENWFKRVEEGVFVMFSLGIPLLLAMRSRLTDNLEIMMPKLTREVRSVRELENLNKGMDREDFVKQLQRELLFNEDLSRLFSPRDACYKLSRMSGNLVVPGRAEYKKLFKDVWFFGEELAYNKILGKAFQYKQKDNVLMIENESVDIEGVIVHVRRRRGKYTFGSNLE